VHATSRQDRAADGIKWLQADLADLSVARQLISTVRPDLIFHLAGAVGAGPQLELVLPTYQSLLCSSVNLLLVSAALRCRRIILTGSLTEPSPETLQPVPSSPYAAAKWASGAYARMFHSLYGVPVVIARPFMTYGPGQAPTKIVPSVIRSLLAGEAPKLSSGRFRADWIYVSDVIDGLIKAATVPGIEGETFDLGTGTLHSVRAIVERIVSIMNSTVEPRFGVLPDRPDEREWAADLAHTAKIGWAPMTSLEEGLRRTVDWYRDAQLEQAR
jgi:nucleoside-diphosphate-sugar epimerase